MGYGVIAIQVRYIGFTRPGEAAPVFPGGGTLSAGSGRIAHPVAVCAARFNRSRSRCPIDRTAAAALSADPRCYHLPPVYASVCSRMQPFTLRCDKKLNKMSILFNFQNPQSLANPTFSLRNKTFSKYSSRSPHNYPPTVLPSGPVSVIRKSALTDCSPLCTSWKPPYLPCFERKIHAGMFFPWHICC